MCVSTVLSETPAVAQVVPEGPCNRECLIGIADSYLTALAAHDPSRVSIARGAQYTENTRLLMVGEGLWQSTSERPTTFQVYVPDSSVQEVGFLGAMKESGKPVVLALRLEVKDRQITEIEHIVQHNLDDFTRNLDEYVLPNLSVPRAGLLATVPPAERVSREQMLAAANSYYDSIVQGDGNLAPFADDCIRRENGFGTTSNLALPPGLGAWTRIFVLGCREQMNTKALTYITSIDLRRVQIADPETGLVFGLVMFRRPEQEHTIKIVGVPGLDTMNRDFPPSARFWAHVFKVQADTLHEIEAMGGLVLPLNANTSW